VKKNIDEYIPIPTPNTFCSPQSAMSMYMDGFSWTLPGDPDKPCLLFLSRHLLLSTSARFWVACSVATAFGLATEWLLMFQQTASTKGNASMRIVLHFVTILVGYIDMLLVMTYSFELMMSVVAGLLVGRIVSMKYGAGAARAREQSRDYLCCPESSQ